VKNYQVRVSIEEELKAWLLARAEERGCSLSQAARELLHRAMREEVQRGK
jgi:plasmid stability protein